MTKETELIALVEEYQSRLTKQKETIRKLEGKIIVLEHTQDDVALHVMLQRIRQIPFPALERVRQSDLLNARVKYSGMHQHGSKKPVAHHMERPSTE